MLPHPDTVCVLKRMTYLATLAEAARGRLAAELSAPADRRSAFAAVAGDRLRGTVAGLRTRRDGRASPVAASAVPVAPPVR